MAITAQTKRYAFLIHRWTGVGMCILMALWFASGIVMLFIGFPKLTPWERLSALSSLTDKACCIVPEAAIAHGRSSSDIGELILTSIRGQPHYVIREGKESYKVVSAATGELQPAVGKDLALDGARAFMPGAGAEYLGTVQEDRWTHSRSLDPHRPLHLIQMLDANSTQLYVSSLTGQVMLDASVGEQRWNYVGAWLHWLYMFRNQPSDPVWSWTIIVLSGIGVVTAFTGVLNGVWRWRFSGAYKNGKRTPFRENFLRWHHLLGLIFGTILFIWIFSGLMSMNPLGIFDPKGKHPDMEAYQGGNPASLRLNISPSDMLSLFQKNGFQPRELEWHVMNGKPYILARDGTENTKLIVQGKSQFAVVDQLPEQELLAAARRLFPVPIQSYQMLEQYDAHYYKRGVESMYGSNERRLPALRIIFKDPEETWIHLNVHTGQVELSMDRSQRLGRWLFNLLHSWDLPGMLNFAWLREIVLVLLSIGGLLLSSTAIVIGMRRIRKWWRKTI